MVASQPTAGAGEGAEESPPEGAGWGAGAVGAVVIGAKGSGTGFATGTGPDEAQTGFGSPRRARGSARL